MLEGMWIFREERNTVSCLMQLVCDTYVTRTFLPENGENREIIRQSLYVEYIGHKNMSLFSFCLGIFKQLVFSNVSSSLTCFPPKAKYLFISGILKKGIHKSCRPSLWPLLDLNPTPSSGKYIITQGFS